MFNIGDTIVQTYRRGIKPKRIVLKCYADIAIVYCYERGFCRVHQWSHKLVVSPTEYELSLAKEKYNQIANLFNN